VLPPLEGSLVRRHTVVPGALVGSSFAPRRVDPAPQRQMWSDRQTAGGKVRTWQMPRHPCSPWCNPGGQRRAKKSSCSFEMLQQGPITSPRSNSANTCKLTTRPRSFDAVTIKPATPDIAVSVYFLPVLNQSSCQHVRDRLAGPCAPALLCGGPGWYIHDIFHHLPEEESQYVSIELPHTIRNASGG